MLRSRAEPVKGSLRRALSGAPLTEPARPPKHFPTRRRRKLIERFPRITYIARGPYGGGRSASASESVPQGRRLQSNEDRLKAVPGVQNVHDLHVWAITSGKNSLTAFLVVTAEGKADEVLRECSVLLEDEFGITQSTMQVECASYSIGQRERPDP